MKIKISIEIDFESWFSEKENEPKNRKEWQEFFEKYYIPEAEVIGIDENQICINSSVVSVKINKKQN